MKIITRITRTKSGQYLYNGHVFNCFLDARREMSREKPRLLALWSESMSPAIQKKTKNAVS